MENEVKQIEGMEGLYIIQKVKLYCKIVELENNFLFIKDGRFEIK